MPSASWQVSTPYSSMSIYHSRQTQAKGCILLCCCPCVQVVREGTDVSIFTYSRMRYVVMQAVAELEKKGYNPEVRGGAQKLACLQLKWSTPIFVAAWHGAAQVRLCTSVYLKMSWRWQCVCAARC
eukprot:GHUV01034977.1.p1 GENE.GHUV01034977.1~~GHUV01034977.1.p1  ORF type:complete len:126 (-),score=15.78 GHUV01034977.1:204-581(-)